MYMSGVYPMGDCPTTLTGSGNKTGIPQTLRFYPSRLKGTWRIPVSKSDMHRALLIAALSAGESAPVEILAPGEWGEDVLATAACIRALGGTVEREGDICKVYPCTHREKAVLDCGESGTTLRFLLPVAPFFGETCDFIGRGRLPMRPIGPLQQALRHNGVRFTRDTLPFTVMGKPLPGVYTLPGNISSQFISALLIAAPLMGEGVSVEVTGKTESLGYIRMTRDTMERFGVSTEEQVHSGGRVYTVQGKGYVSPGRYVAEGDWSSATPFLALNRLGHDLCLEGLRKDSHQPDAACGALFDRVATGTDIDVSACPDSMPALAALAACREGETRITGAARLRLKESDRISSITEVLTALGVDVTEYPDGLTVRGGRVRGGTVDAHNDHRVAMALAVLACEAEGPITVTGFDCVAKSWPDFLSAYEALGGLFDELKLR